MNRIRILPETVAVQIAAGEVIERPVSVIRELLDNSIDAQSNKIEITIAEGGRRVIRVKDNGTGMGRDDLLLSLERHATSKIHSVSDLGSVKTLGFRGEALPSIASVSRMEITTRLADELVGHRLKVAGGKLISIDETGAPAGTDVEVRDLFFNIPARRKFLRSVKTETDHIVDTLSRIILPHTHIQLRLNSSHKTLLHFPETGNERDRLSVLMGRDVARSLIHARAEIDGLRVTAYFVPPEQSRSRADRIYIYVNKRSVRDRLVTRALMEGYGQRLMKGRYPQAVVFLDMDASMVDVNVHPTKQEVRFRQSQLVYRAIESIIGKTLKDRLKPLSDFSDQRIANQRESFPGRMIAEPAWEYSDGDKETTAPPGDTLLRTPPIKAYPQIIGQLKDTYILCQTMDGLLVIDQHAAHERIVYESLKKSYQSSRLECQAFLIPHQIELSLKESRVVLEKCDQLERLGFDLHHFGGSTFLLRSVPSILVNTQWDIFLRDLIPILETEDDLTTEQALDRLLTVMACHSAIRAGQRMAHGEMVRLLEDLEGTLLPTNCPHGRPISKKFSFYEIEKMFKRIT